MVLEQREKDNILYIKAILIILVITSHCFSYYGRIGGLTQLESGIQYLLYSSHVPIFFIISGFLCHSQDVLGFYKKKLFRVLIPLWFFSLLKASYLIVSSRNISINSIFRILYEALIIGKYYWFGYAIIVMFLLIPLLWTSKTDRHYRKKTAVVLVTIIIFNTFYSTFNFHFIPQLFQLESSILYLPFFLIGVLGQWFYFNLKKTTPVKRIIVSIVSLLIVVLSLFLFYLDAVFNEYWVKMVTALSMLPLIIMLARIIPDRIGLSLKIIGSYSWQLMLLDSFFHVALFWLFDKITSINSLVVVLIIVLDVMLGVLSCFIAKRIPIVRTLFGF